MKARVLILAVLCACRSNATPPTPSATAVTSAAAMASVRAGPASATGAEVAGSARPLVARGTERQAPSAPGRACDPKGKRAHEVAAAGESFRLFVQDDPSGEQESTAAGDMPRQVICIERKGALPEVLVQGHGVPEDGGVQDTLAGFNDLVISPDAQTLYFSSAAWTTSTAAHAVDLKTKKERFLCDGVVHSVFTAGPHKGMLRVLHFPLDPDHSVESPKYRGRIDEWLVVTPQGKRLAKTTPP